MSRYILETCELEYEYPDGTKALKGINLGIEKGKKTAVLGPNGAGKSTLFLHFNGILKPKSGRVLFYGREIEYNRRYLMELRKNVGIVFQDPDTQIFAGTVFQEVSFGPLNLGLKDDEVKKRVEKALITAGVYDLAQKPTHLLSYGQKKRVCIAGVLAMEPEVIIFDEPTAYLDPKHCRILLETLDLLHQSGKQIILSTHDVNLAYSWADNILIVKDGKLLESGAPEEIFENDEVLNQADLQKPMLLEVYQILFEKGLIGKRQPKSIEELRCIL